MLKNPFEVLRSVLISRQRTPSSKHQYIVLMMTVEFSQSIFPCIWNGWKVALAELPIKVYSPWKEGRKKGRKEGLKVFIFVPVCYNSFITLRVLTRLKLPIFRQRARRTSNKWA